MNKLFRNSLASAQQTWRWAWRHWRVIGTAVLVLAAGTLAALFVVSTQLALRPSLAGSSSEHKVNAPVEIALGQAVRADLAYSLQPGVPGEWRAEKNLLGVTKLVFVPMGKGFSTKTTYAVEIKNIKRVTGQMVEPIKLAFTTEAAPAVSSFNPHADAQHVPADAPLVAKLASANRGMRELSVQLEPAAELKLQVKDDQTFSWQPVKPLEQGKQYTLKLFDARSEKPGEPLKTVSFTTSPEPAITDTNNEHFLYPEGVISVTFNTPMKPDAPGIRCECQGEGKWASPTEYHFTPTAVEVNKTYKYVVPRGLRAENGGLRADDAAYEVRTPGYVQAGIGGLGSSAKLNAAITVTFDQVVDKASAEARFGISPQVNGSFRWLNNQTMQFVPSEYAPQTGYAVTINPGVAPTHFGLPSTAAFSMRFTTEPRTVKLAVPVLRQQHPSSCEAAALRMALAYRGVHDVDASIVQKMGYNPRPKDHASNSWDDPSQMYVGDINGSQSRYEAYGAYAPPIAKAAQVYGRGASVHYGVSANFIAQQIYNGNPVIIIGTVSHMRPQYVSWNGPNGVVHAWMGEHARTVVGVVGNPENPLGFWVNDPYRGTHEYWSPGRLMSDINAIPQLASQVAVIY